MTDAASLELVEAAVRAPSSHNTQPWLFRVGGREVDLFADRTRALPVNDPDDRELTISCGAALFNLRTAAARAGLAAEVRLLPDRDDPDRLARIQLREGPADEAIAALAGAIHARATTRAAFQEAPLPRGLADELAAAARAEGARLHPVVGDARRAVAALVAEGDHAQFGDPDWRRELASWMHPRREGDGLMAPPWLAPVTRLVLRRFDLGDRIASADEALVHQAPLLVAFSTDEDGPVHWLRTGQALQRVLLLAAARGVQAGYLNQPCQVAALRPRLAREVAPGEQPQLLVRLGVPEAPGHPTPRRPVRDVLL